jgi:type IV pilus assembly protein PilY1
VVAFYGSNDGHLRAVNGNQTGVGAGEELWSFIAPEHFLMLERLQLNAPKIRVTGTPAGAAVPRHYAMDGPIGTYLKRNADGTVNKAHIYTAMRRGGRAIYAFDVTNPAAPIFMWKVDHNSTGMSRLGQTWSEPRVARIKGQTDPVLIFGGGYDPEAEDIGGASTIMGDTIFVLNARTGALLRSFTTLSGGGSIGRSVAADVSIMDSDSDGLIDRGYAVDLGGQVYRIDFEQANGDHAPADWSVYKVADLSGGTTTGRKFFYAPDLVKSRDFLAIMVGSGDREKPLSANTQDHFFQIFDRRLDKGAPATVTPTLFTDLTAMTESGTVSGAGCYLALATGEKVVNAPTSQIGYAYFGTNQPHVPVAGSTSCSANLGRARTYALPLFCTSATGTVLAGGGLPPSPVAGVVEITKPNGTTEQVPFVIGAPNANGSAIEASRVRSSITSPRQRKYWFQETRR